MNIQTILFPIHITQAVESLLSIASSCNQRDIHLDVHIFGESLPIPPMTVGDTSSAAIWAERMIENERQLQDAAAKIDALLLNTGVQFSVSHETGDGVFVDDSVAARAKYADLTVIQRTERGNTLSAFSRRLCHGVLFAAGKPLLIIDKPPKSLDFNNILICWNEKRAATRAISASIEMLIDARRVFALSIDADKQNLSHKDQIDWDLSTYLARHNINLAVTAKQSMGNPVSEVIQQHASEVGADLIICGAYGRSPLRERVFGGTTSELLEECSLPVLMVH